jgi:hypothetical protein
MVSLFFPETYFKRKGHALNKVGIKLLAINKFLSHYLKTGEPFPLTDNFINKVKKDVSSKFNGYTSGPPGLFPANTASPKTSEEIKKLVEDIEVSTRAFLTSRKEYELEHLIRVAEFCFIWADVSFYMSYAFSSDSRKKDSLRRNNFTSQEKTNYVSQLVGSLWGSSTILESWSNVADGADACLKRTNREIGYWTRHIEELRKNQQKARTTNIKEGKKYSKKRQRVLEIFYTFEDRKKRMENPYKFAKEIIEKWSNMGYKDDSPSQNTIKKYLEEEKNKK